LDFTIFSTPEAWISLITLMFLEIVLGVDNLVFIAITTNRLPKEKQQLGRRLGLLGALCMRILFLCVASYLVHMITPLFTIDLGVYLHGFSIRDLVLLVGGAYLIYKGISEVREVLKLTEIKCEECHETRKRHLITLPRAILTIMVMDLVFSIDSVITAVGLAQHLIIMIIAVMAAVMIMMLFINQISDFINKNTEVKILALVFIVAIGVLLVVDSLGFHIGIELLGISIEKIIVYFAMIFSIIITLIQMAFKRRLELWRAELKETKNAEVNQGVATADQGVAIADKSKAATGVDAAGESGDFADKGAAATGVDAAGEDATPSGSGDLADKGEGAHGDVDP